MEALENAIALFVGEGKCDGQNINSEFKFISSFRESSRADAYNQPNINTMKYISKNLLPGESIVYRAKRHWMLYSISALISLLAVWFLLFGAEACLFGLILILLLVIPFSILTYLDIKTSEFVVTNKRVIVKVGVIRRYSLELLLSKIEGLRIEQGILGRIFDYGTVVASGTGSS